jgi:hypothetical protein
MDRTGPRLVGGGLREGFEGVYPLPESMDGLLDSSQ